MAIGRSLDLTREYKQNVYNIYLDLSGWDRTTLQVVTPASPVFIYGTNDPNALLGVRDGNAMLATNHTPLQATNLATGAAVSTMAANGLYKVDVNAQFLKLQGADVYRLFAFHTKID